MEKARHSLMNTPKMSAMVGKIGSSFLVSLTKSTSFSALAHLAQCCRRLSDMNRILKEKYEHDEIG